MLEMVNKSSEEGWLPKDIKASIENFLVQLKKLAPKKKPIEEILPEFYRKAIYSEGFDKSIILLMRFAVARFIAINQKCIAKYKLTVEDVVNLLLNANIAKESKKINEFEVWMDLLETIYNGISAILEVNLTIYSCKLNEEGIKSWQYSFHLEEGKEYQHKIEIMESPRELLSILYSKQFHDSILSKYDKSINGKIITNTEKIIQPTCCCKSFYKKAYYMEMIRLNGRLSKECIVCKENINELAYSSLKDMDKSRSKIVLIIFVLLLILAVGSMIFIISKA